MKAGEEPRRLDAGEQPPCLSRLFAKPRYRRGFSVGTVNDRELLVNRSKTACDACDSRGGERSGRAEVSDAVCGGNPVAINYGFETGERRHAGTTYCTAAWSSCSPNSALSVAA